MRLPDGTEVVTINDLPNVQHVGADLSTLTPDGRTVASEQGLWNVSQTHNGTSNVTHATRYERYQPNSNTVAGVDKEVKELRESKYGGVAEANKANLLNNEVKQVLEQAVRSPETTRLYTPTNNVTTATTLWPKDPAADFPDLVRSERGLDPEIAHHAPPNEVHVLHWRDQGGRAGKIAVDTHVGASELGVALAERGVAPREAANAFHSLASAKMGQAASSTNTHMAQALRRDAETLLAYGSKLAKGSSLQELFTSAAKIAK